MADFQNTSSAKTNTFNKGMVKDLANIFIGEGIWTNAINAINKTHHGELGAIGNEPSNSFCTDTTYTIIGFAHIEKTRWVIFCTDDIDSEIGIFDESNCSYTALVNDKCLNFKKAYLITAVVKRNYDCTYSAYWQDNNNPDRIMNLDRIPWVTEQNSTGPNCYELVPITPLTLDCDLIKLHPNIEQPCISVSRGLGAGQIVNSSNFAVIAYTENGIRLTDYSMPSNVQSVWNHSGIGNSLEVNISNLDTNFEEYELVIVSSFASQTVAKRIGYYNINQTKHIIDSIPLSLVTVDLALIPLKSVVYYKSKKMFDVNGYLLRTSVTTRPEINYQPQANNINSEWIAVKYPEKYYWEGGNKVGYMRDEVYSFFIRWIYIDGTRTSSFHIPGRAAITSERATPSPTSEIVDANLETQQWQVYDTAGTPIPVANEYTEDGGQIVFKGKMAFWEAETEKYPSDNVEVWGSLCGEKIRHHKMPSNETMHIHSNTNDIYVLGVRFLGIDPPKDANGAYIPDIVGYEILRGSRFGNKSIVAKGIFNNMWWFSFKETSNHNPILRKGLYQNYPYNDIHNDKFLTHDYTILDWTTDSIGGNYYNKVESSPYLGTDPTKAYYSLQYHSFHSPETNFDKPFIGGGLYAKIYTREDANVIGRFELPYKHPKFKLISDTAFTTAMFVGMGIALSAALGKTTYSGSVGTIIPATDLQTVSKEVNTTALGFVASFGPNSAINLTSSFDMIGAVAQFAANFIYFLSIGTSSVLKVIEGLIKFRDYALQYNSHGFYGESYSANSGIAYRRKIDNGKAQYVGNGIQDFDQTYRIFNLNRNKYIATKFDKDLMPASNIDNTRIQLKDINHSKEFYAKPYDYGYIRTKSSTYYGALKIHNGNQYGQLDSVIQIPISCMFDKGMKTSGALFGGDTYINRYTEKNPYMFFNTWLYDMLDGTEFTYTNYINGPVPRYFANFNSFDVEDFDIGFDPNSTVSILGANISYKIALKTPSDNHRLDRHQVHKGFFAVKNGWFYLFYNGVRDFYCESEFNLAYRDYGDKDTEKFYDPYGLSFSDLTTMFRSDLIKEPILNKYDLSLSVSKLYTNFTSWGKIQPRDYNPTLYSTCFEYYPNRLIYSLQQKEGMKRDSWLNFLPLNYKDFEGEICNVKSLNASGAIILFENHEPRQFIGIDQLQTTGGTKITIGDGGLFQQNMQGLVNADDVLEYGSCISSRSAVNTPAGLFYVSQKAGKVFQVGEGLNDISRMGMKHWFNTYLPSYLLKTYPDYPLYDNPVKGIGVQTIYDNTYDLLYITKKDYLPLRDDLLYTTEGQFYIEEETTVYICGEGYTYNSGTGLCEKEGEEPHEPRIITRPLQTPCHFDNPRCWKPAHWTISYDPINKMWLSFHDWHPNLLMPSQEHFYSILDNGFWKHNEEWESYLNFYGKDYGWEIEYPITTPNNITTLRNIEYTLEVLKYYNEGRDYNHILDANFDRMIVYNSEQISGLLKLNLKGKNAPLDLINYPIVTGNNIDVLYSKEENKYRVNQFWDVTKDRGEFTGNTIPMWVTEPNGYIKNINPNYTNYLKLERKKFRHYGNIITLRKSAIKDKEVAYGYLYNWYAASNPLLVSSNVWRLFTEPDFADAYLAWGETTEVAGKMRSLRTQPLFHPRWNLPNIAAENEFNFNALPAGGRLPVTGQFINLGYSLGLWSSIVNIGGQALYYSIKSDDINTDYGYTFKTAGLSVQFIRDAVGQEILLPNGTYCNNYIGNDGRQYKTIKFGNLVYMVENLAETKWRDGTLIPNITDNTAWANDTKGAMCSYENNDDYVFYYKEGLIDDIRNRKYILKLTNSKHLNSSR